MPFQTCDEPRVRDEIVNRALDCITNGPRRVPAGGADLRGVEKDEGIVADPTPIAAAVGQRRLEPEALANPTHRIVHGAESVDAEVEDVEAVGASEPPNDC